MLLVVEAKDDDEDTDVDESAAEMTSGDGEKMDTGSETKPGDETEKAVVIDDKENGTELPKDSEAEKPPDAKANENEAEKPATDGETVIDLEKEDEKKDVVVIEDEEEDPEPEDEVIEDRDDGGEDPSEVEIEKFNMPLEQSLLSGK